MYGFIGGGGDPYATPYTGGNGRFAPAGVGCPVLPPWDGGAQCSGVDGVVAPDDGEDGVPGCVSDGGVVVAGVPGEWGGSA